MSINVYVSSSIVKFGIKRVVLRINGTPLAPFFFYYIVINTVMKFFTQFREMYRYKVIDSKKYIFKNKVLCHLTKVYDRFYAIDEEDSTGCRWEHNK